MNTYEQKRLEELRALYEEPSAPEEFLEKLSSYVSGELRAAYFRGLRRGQGASEKVPDAVPVRPVRVRGN